MVVMDEALREGASGVAQALRRAGRAVDLVLEAKKMKWVFKVGAPPSRVSQLHGGVPVPRADSAEGACCVHGLHWHGLMSVHPPENLWGGAQSQVWLAGAGVSG